MARSAPYAIPNAFTRKTILKKKLNAVFICRTHVAIVRSAAKSKQKYENFCHLKRHIENSTFRAKH